jgi:hypothetical protein
MTTITVPKIRATKATTNAGHLSDRIVIISGVLMGG